MQTAFVWKSATYSLATKSTRTYWYGRIGSNRPYRYFGPADTRSILVDAIADWTAEDLVVHDQEPPTVDNITMIPLFQAVYPNARATKARQDIPSRLDSDPNPYRKE